MDKLLFYPTPLPFIHLCFLHQYTFFILLLSLLYLSVNFINKLLFLSYSSSFIHLCSLLQYTSFLTYSSSFYSSLFTSSIYFFFILLLFLLFLSVHFMDKLLFYPTSLPFIPLCSFHQYTSFLPYSSYQLCVFQFSTPFPYSYIFFHSIILSFLLLSSIYVSLDLSAFYISLFTLSVYFFFTLLLFLLYLSIHFINILLFYPSSLPFIPLCSLHRYTSFLFYSSSFYTSLFTSSHVDLTVLSIFQKAVTFDHNLSPYT